MVKKYPKLAECQDNLPPVEKNEILGLKKTIEIAKLVVNLSPKLVGSP